MWLPLLHWEHTTGSQVAVSLDSERHSDPLGPEPLRAPLTLRRPSEKQAKHSAPAEVEFNKDAGKIILPLRNFLGLEDMQAGSGVSWAPGMI